MKIVLINVPSRKGKAGFWLPLGLLYAASIIERCGHKPIIVDPYIDDVDLKKFDSGDFSVIDAALSLHKPVVVGFGGIATSYPRTKKLSRYIKEKYPRTLQIVGGPLASVYELLLTKSDVDVVFHGETEVSLPVFLEKVGTNGPFSDVPGISYLQDGKLSKTQMPEQVKDLDSIPMPSCGLLDIDKYIFTAGDRLVHYKQFHKDHVLYDTVEKKIGDKSRYLPIVTSRGCTHRCSFCYRHVKGIRQHSVGYVIKFIKFLKDKYKIDGLQFGDELFNSDPAWVMEFCDALEREKIDIFYFVVGARISKIDEKMLKRLKETGCVDISYGQESGSDVILKEYGKGVTRRQNTDITLLTTKKVGIPNTVQLVIGSPSETNETIADTIQFLKDVEAYNYSLNYLIPLPGTPVWKHVEEKNMIKDIEKYLGVVAESGGEPIVNLTKETDSVWRNWKYRIRKEMKMHYYKKTNMLYYHIYKTVHKITDVTTPLISQRIKRFIPRWLRRLY
ncbi:MAG: radical SAM protein [Candidatus Omnitrophota bacterium]|jgi:radical SAM superfamily enzyme YgiQ (UPF0313 family)